MTKSITPTQIKKNNRSLIYHYLYQHPGSSQQELALQLHLSRPTVASNLSFLESEGRISKSGQIASESAGRKAAAYAIVPDFRIALGVELLKNEVKVVAVNLYGKSIARDSFSETYTDTPEYYQMICDKILIFARALPCESSQILGIGFAMQALISADKKSILYGKILSCTGLSLSVFSDHRALGLSGSHRCLLSLAQPSSWWLRDRKKDDHGRQARAQWHDRAHPHA